MARERLERTETDWLGNEQTCLCEDGEQIGEITTEERGGFLGIGADETRVFRGVDGDEISHSRQEERGEFLGIGSEQVDVN